MFDYLILIKNDLEWNIPILMAAAIIAVLYIILLKQTTEFTILQKQPLIFLLTLGLFVLVVGSPLSTISHLSFSLHMIQMSILFFFYSATVVIWHSEARLSAIVECYPSQVFSFCKTCRCTIYFCGPIFHVSFTNNIKPYLCSSCNSI